MKQLVEHDAKGQEAPMVISPWDLAHLLKRIVVKVKHARGEA